MSELETIISELKNRKAMGLYSISNEVIKLLGPETKSYILSFVTTCIRDCEVPADLKKGCNTLIYKGEDRKSFPKLQAHNSKQHLKQNYNPSHNHQDDRDYRERGHVAR